MCTDSIPLIHLVPVFPNKVTGRSVKRLYHISGIRNIEDAIDRHPAVAEVTVIGVPDEYRGEAPKAFVRLQEGVSLTEAELLEFLDDHLSKIERPSMIEFRAELPKTMIGKLSKKELVEEEMQRSDA